MGMTNTNLQTEPIDNFSSGSMETTRDKFHDGAFEVLQPSTRGNRSGMDALLLAASLPKNATGVLADFGSGAGVAGLAALNLNKELELLCIEKNPEMAELARKTLQLSSNSKFRNKTKIIEQDITSGGVDRLKAGLAPDSVVPQWA